MPSKSTTKKGALTLQEKVYIAENLHSKSIEDIAKKLKRTEKMVGKYIDKLTPEAKVETQDKKVKDNNFVEKTSGATVMNENGAAFPYRPKAYESKFRVK